MADRPRRVPPAILAGLVAGLSVMLLAWAAPTGWRETLRERVFDVMLAAAKSQSGGASGIKLAIVDIDAESLQAIGPWPWRREVIARLITSVTAARPAAVALDLLLSGRDIRSPAASARQLAAETGRHDLYALADALVDDDQALRKAISSGPVVLGWVLDPRGEAEITETPILVRDGATIPEIWAEDGATGPPTTMAEAAAGAGALSLSGDTDGVVRRVPLFVAVRGAVYPSLALEAFRLAAGSSGYIVSGHPPWLGIGEMRRPLSADGQLRLVPSRVAVPSLRASEVLSGRADFAGLERAVVFIGGSAPELGALRPSLRDPLTASVTLHADAVRQLAAGVGPLRLAHAPAWEIAAALLLALAGVAAAHSLRPLTSTLMTVAVVMAVLLAALWLASADRLIDPSVPIASGLAAFLVASLAAFSETRLAQMRLRRRFEQHLAPGVVARIVANPSSMRLSGERREITALFTDIEGFTQTTRTIGPEQLVSLLDGYFGGVTRIVGEHGGMVDKLVGDAVHALFNAPLDLADHPMRAVECAIALLAWTEAYRSSGLAAEAELGRTRIGIETGAAIVGDVGFGSKLDYTAHGDAVNTAARLEALNKELGSSICVGPIAASRCDPALIRPLASVELRGLGTLDVFTVAGRA